MVEPVTGPEGRSIEHSPSERSVTSAAGWGELHLFCTLGSSADSEAVIAAVKATQDGDHQVVTFAVLGHKAEVGFMAVGPDLWRLRRLQAELNAAGVTVVDSYLS